MQRAKCPPWQALEEQRKLEKGPGRMRAEREKHRAARPGFFYPE